MKTSASSRGLSSILSVLAASGAIACSSGHAADPSGGDDGTEQALTDHGMPPVLPHPGGTGDQAPWGGSNASNWRPEAMLANATSDALNRAWALANVTDAVVAVPLKMYSSQFSEYGDGQLNAVPDFVHWPVKERPPVVATMVSFKSAPTKVLIRLDRALPTNATSIEIVYDANGTKKTVEVSGTRNGDGDLELEWMLPSDTGLGLLSTAAVALRPKGWGDWFPLWFRMPVRKTNELHASTTRFGDGRGIFDREGVSVQSQSSGNTTQTPFDRLIGHSFSIAYNNGQSGNVQPFTPADIHAQFPFNNQMVTTGVGRGWTWVADERPNGFKVMYTCFEGRRPDLEASAPNGGVASGGGWHFIGDSAETIVNDLEAGPLVVGSAGTFPFWPQGLPSGGFAYALSDVATVRWLFPGEAFVTPRGRGWVPNGQGQSVLQDNFHWYFFPGAKNVCTEELVNTGAVPENYNP